MIHSRFLLVIFSLVFSIASQAIYASSFPLQVERGSKPAIKDNLGRTVLIRGVNLNALGDYYQANLDQPTILPASEQDFKEIASKII